MDSNKVGGVMSKTIFANVYATMLVDCRQLMLPVVNEMHGTRFTSEDEVVLSNEEHYLKNKDEPQKRVSDSHFSIRSKGALYRVHHECQTRPDVSILKRMAEYGGEIAVENSMLEGNKLVTRLPLSGVLYLQSTRNTPDEFEIMIQTSEGEVIHKVRIMKLEHYTVEDIFKKQLFILIPFYILVYKKRFFEYNKEEGKLTELLKVYEDILDRFNNAAKEGKIDEYAVGTILAMSRKVIDHVTTKYKNIKERLGDIMGGKVLEHPVKTAYRNGERKGKIEAHISLMKDGIISMAEAAKRLGMAEDEVMRYLK